jgi:ribosome-associated protein
VPAASQEPVGGYYVTGRGHRIAIGAVSWSATRSGGPGGQHANTTDSAVTITIDVAATGLSPVVIERVIAAFGPTVVATSAKSRSQWRNRQLAWEEALARFDEAAAPPRPPRARTRPSRAARETRLRDKRAAGERKRARQRPDRDS